ncbi:hypothetical protein VMCG_08970 [Cytospora schulzeri]|uniref:DUF6546 domain-containing protein n=1 Tax=Cytospora schulzeri TaxID=448051 RepID=A0A423VPP5_9PEZI|nr:hypothetical protein VMCG_08970 [Valsa malicola]
MSGSSPSPSARLSALILILLGLDLGLGLLLGAGNGYRTDHGRGPGPDAGSSAGREEAPLAAAAAAVAAVAAAVATAAAAAAAAAAVVVVVVAVVVVVVVAAAGRGGPGAKDRLFGDARGLCFDQNAASAIRMGQKLPEVNIIHSLTIRRQFYRAFSARRGLAQMIRSLPGLHDFTYEPWRSPFRNVFRGSDGLPVVRNTTDKPYAVLSYTQRGRFMRDSDHEYLLKVLLRDESRLKRMSIFEDADDVFYETATTPRFIPPSYQLPGPLARRLAKWSRDLEELHASQNFDAECFFFPEPDVGGGPARGYGALGPLGDWNRVYLPFRKARAPTQDPALVY